MITYIGKKTGISVLRFDFVISVWISRQPKSQEQYLCFQVDQYLHELRAWASLPEEDVITIWSRRQTDTACPTGPRPFSCASIPGLRGTRVLRMRMAYSWPQKQTV